MIYVHQTFMYVYVHICVPTRMQVCVFFMHTAGEIGICKVPPCNKFSQFSIKSYKGNAGKVASYPQLTYLLTIS